MKTFLTFLLFMLIASNILAQKKQTVLPKKPTAKELANIKAGNKKQAAKTKFQYFVIKADSSTYGYSIYANGNLYIEQKTIPAMGGNKGFTDISKAAKTAQLVIQKIKQGEIPPSITIADLKKIKAL